MAKLTLEQSIQTVIKSLQRCKDMNMSEDVFLSIFRDRLLDEDLVDKNRRNEVHMAVNKHFNCNYQFKQVKAADPRLADSVDLQDKELDVSVLDNNKPAVNAELNNTNTTSEDNTMNNELNTAAENNTINTTATATVTSQPSAESTIPETKVELELETPQLAMPEGSSIKNSWLAAGGAVIGGGLALLKSDENFGGYVGAAAGVAIAYFGTEHFFNEMDPTLLNRGVIIGAGMAVGAGMTVAGNMAVNRFASEAEATEIVMSVPGLANNTSVTDTAGLF